MKPQLPKGLIVSSLITIAGCLSVANSVLKPDGYMVYGGQVLRGLPFKIYYSALSAAILFIGVGLLLLRRWSYFCFLVVSAYSALVAVANIFLTSNDTLIRTGWMSAHVSRRNFDLFQVGVICVVALMALWLLRYRGEFQKDPHHCFQGIVAKGGHSH